MADWLKAPDSSSVVSDQQSVGSSHKTLLSLNKILHDNCSVLRMGHEAIGSVC